MTTSVALLRGVNVGGRNRIAMADLRERLVTLGYRDVTTYLQSGNVVFQASGAGASQLARAIEREIRRAFRLDVDVLLRTSAQLRSIIANSPFAGRRADAKALHVTFLAERPDASRVKALSGRSFGRDELLVRGREVYLRCPDGYGRSKLSNTFLERELGTRATTRNWKTVTALLELAGG